MTSGASRAGTGAKAAACVAASGFAAVADGASAAWAEAGASRAACVAAWLDATATGAWIATPAVWPVFAAPGAWATTSPSSPSGSTSIRQCGSGTSGRWFGSLRSGSPASAPSVRVPVPAPAGSPKRQDGQHGERRERHGSHRHDGSLNGLEAPGGSKLGVHACLHQPAWDSTLARGRPGRVPAIALHHTAARHRGEQIFTTSRRRFCPT